MLYQGPEWRTIRAWKFPSPLESGSLAHDTGALSSERRVAPSGDSGKSNSEPCGESF